MCQRPRVRSGVQSTACAVAAQALAADDARDQMAGKKQQTFAKLQRERKVKERRQMKQEKKQAAAARKLAAANNDPMSGSLQDEGSADAPTGAIPPPPE